MITVEKFQELLQESIKDKKKKLIYVKEKSIGIGDDIKKALNLDSKKSIQSLAKKVIKKQDEKTIMEVSRELWGDVYDYGGATLEQIAMEVVGYLTDAIFRAKK